MNHNSISKEDRAHLRELAKKQMEYAKLPIMEARRLRWYEHNDLGGDLPMIHFETWTCEADLLPEFRCTTEIGRNIERQLNRAVLNHERIGDDRVVPDYFSVGWHTHFILFDLPVSREHSADAEGRAIGHQFKHPITDLVADRDLLKPSVYDVDRESTMAQKTFLEDLFGDILPVHMGASGLGLSLSQHIVHLMGMEQMFFAMMDTPDAFHEIMDRMTTDYIAYFRWLEREELLIPNNGSNGVAQGTFGFTHELPAPSSASGQTLRTRDLWGYMDSQETVSISPEMFGEFFFPYYLKGAENFGLLNYGCCEPVHKIWESCISKLPNLRKVSISPWCDEAYIGEALKGTHTIFHRKPSPNYVGVGRVFDQDGYREHIRTTLQCARGCKLEFSFRDVYSLGGDPEKPRKAVSILRQEIEREWR